MKKIFKKYKKFKKRVIRKFKNMYINFIIRNYKIDDKKILFLTYQGNYTCNPKYIADEIIKNKLPYKLVWATLKANYKSVKKSGEIPPNVKVVSRRSWAFLKEAYTSKIWIDNAINMEQLKISKREGQVVINTWHGSMGIKKMQDNQDSEWTSQARAYGAKTDYIIVNSEFENKIFDIYWKNVERLFYGHPRNDILIKNDLKQKEEINKRVREKYNLNDKHKILLYAPTFRSDRGFDQYTIDYKMLKQTLKKKFGGNWYVFTRFHHKLRLDSENQKLPDFVINVTDYTDIQELMLISDIGITDYSSWICDYVLTKKPAFLYCADLKSYDQKRGFCYPLNTTPFPITETNYELREAIENFDGKKYQKDINKFLKAMDCCEKGDASKKMVEKIQQIIE